MCKYIHICLCMCVCVCVCVCAHFSVILGVLSFYFKYNRRHIDLAKEWKPVETWLDSRERQYLHVCPSNWTGSLVHESVYTVCTKAFFWKSRSWALRFATNPLLVSKFRMTGASQPLAIRLVSPQGRISLCVYLQAN